MSHVDCRPDFLEVIRQHIHKSERIKTISLACKIMDSPVGKLKLVASDKGLVAILWENDKPTRVRLGEMVEDSKQKVLVQVEQQLSEYFAGKRQAFDLPLDMRGTRFQKDVWE